MKSWIKKTIFSLVFIFILPNNVLAEEAKNTRLGGENRILTSIEISKNVYDKSDTVILVEYNSQLEALLSTILSKKHDAPILISSSDKLAASLLAEIERLEAKNIILVDKEATFSNNIKDSLANYQVSTISGENIEDLAIKLLKEVYGQEKDEVFLTLGYGVLADALSIGSVSADKDLPILLSHSNRISDTTLAALKDLGVKKVNIVGGRLAISERVEEQLLSLGIVYQRIQGSNREDTALEISKAYKQDRENIVVANGYNYADAVTGGYFAYKKNASLLLTQEKKVNLDTLDHISGDVDRLYILGREKAVDPIVERDLNYRLNDYIIREESNNLPIAYKTINIDDTSLEKGTKKVKTEGIDGSKTVLDRVVLKDGREIERRTLREATIKSPQDQVILNGSREIEMLKKEKLYFITEDIYLKAKANKDSRSLLKIPKGSHLQELSSYNKDWYKLTYNNKTGYVQTKLIKKATGYKVANTIIVNKGYPLSSSFNPGINPQALKAVNMMIRDAKKDAIKLNIFSDFRSYNYQKNLFNRYVKKDGRKKAETYSARPGHSEHQTGLAFDIGGANSKYYTSEKLGQMKEGIWMAKNSYKYGLILRYPKDKEDITGYKYEPWHFRYVGVDLAKKIRASGLSLDEYFHAVEADY